jgi:hypothetical protein
MNQRDRYWTTIIIWVAFVIAFLLVFDRVLMIQADFIGMWPEQPMGFMMAQDAEALKQAVASAQQAGPAILAQVQESMRVQIAQRFPLVAALGAALILAATFCTYFVWRNAGLEAYLAREAVNTEKVKRRSRIEMFVEELDTDELDQLRSRLGDEAAPAQAAKF